jgi:hypothetical protein
VRYLESFFGGGGGRLEERPGDPGPPTAVGGEKQLIPDSLSQVSNQILK